MSNKTTSKQKTKVQQAEAPEEISLEALDEEIAARRRELELNPDGPIDTQHTDGSAYYAYDAEEQGLVYTPPDDPPILPSDNRQGVEMGIGFGKAAEEEDDPRAEELPNHFAQNDGDLEEKIYAALRKNGETTTFTDLVVEVEDGIVYLSGPVETLDDVDVVVSVIRDLEGVNEVEENLEVTTL